MWKKTLIAAAVATVSLPSQSAETPANTAPASPDGRQPDRGPTALGAIKVEGGPDETGLKAESQTTSSKLDLSLRETPQSVTVITQESLQDRQVTDFGQALELSAGVTQFSGPGPFGGQAGFGFNETTIRGIAIDDLNDVREDGFINSTYFAIPDMAIYDRIEVIKGPNSVVYGRGSAGGLINRIRKKPLDDARGEIELSAGSFDTYRADVDLTGPLTASGNIKGRLVAAYADDGSFIDGVETGRRVLAPSIQVDFTPRTRLLLEGLYQRDNFKPAPGMPLVDDGGGHFRAPNIPRSLYVGTPNVNDDRWNIYTGTAQLDQDIGDHWLATLRFNKNRTESPIQLDRYAYGLSETGDTTLIRNDFSIDRDIWAGEFRLSGDLSAAGMPVKLATGVEVSDNDYHRRGAYAYLGTANIYLRNFADLPDAEVQPGFEYTTHDKTRGVYLQAQVKPIDRLSVLVGLRHDSADSQYINISGDTASKKKVQDVTGRIGVTYELTENISTYGVFAQSFSPVLFDVDRNGDILEPETGKIFEAGLKTEWLDKRLGINTAAYRIDREHIPVAEIVGPAETPYSVSSGLQRSQGFEVEINGEPVPGWKISGAYNWLDSKFKDPRDPFYGQRPGGAARWQVGLFSSYELQSGPLKGLGFGATVFSIADRGLSPFEQGSLDGYTRVDLNLFYKGIESYDFALSVRNVLDERYVEGADRSSAIAQFGSPTAVLFTARRYFWR
ncbi:MAG: TonB-dependent siderophore receptor [Gammaproteobacteria bacterium]